MNLERKVLRTIREERLIDPADRVLVGVSGGIDSTTLLFLLAELRAAIPFSLGVAHLNHRLRGAESQRDEAFAQELAGRFSLPFHVRAVDVKGYARTHGLSIQHAGRDVRYAYFDELAQAYSYTKIAVAHNCEDQVETFILRITKGTGMRGLSSIPLRRGAIIRPLLFTYRSEITEYAREHSIPYMEDSSNRKDTYERNFIRIHILPLLEKLNPNFRERMLFLLQDLTSVNGLFDREAEQFLEKEAGDQKGEIDLPAGALTALHEELRFRVLSRTLYRVEPKFIPLREHIRLVEAALFSPRPNISVTLPHRITVSKAYDNLRFFAGEARASIQGRFAIGPGQNVLEPFRVVLDVSFADGVPGLGSEGKEVAFLDAARVGDLYVRTFQPGDRFIPLGMENSVKLKDFFISRKIPLERRRQIPLLLSGSDIIWVIGERIDERYKVTGDTSRVLRAAVHPLNLCPPADLD